MTLRARSCISLSAISRRFALLLASFVLLVKAQDDCASTAYSCSFGKLKPFNGDIEPGPGLKSALATRSYNKEIILFVTSEQKVVHAIHAINSLATHKIEHVLLISHQASCAFVAKQLPTVGCAWSSFQFSSSVGLDGIGLLWTIRYRTLARAVRMGYNVLSSDTDVIFFHNPYNFLKVSPFRDMQWLQQPEILYDESEYPNVFSLNGGFVYVQNASPSGPVMWLLSETTERLLRWLGDSWEYASSIGIARGCNYMDQDSLADALPSVMVGRPMFERTFMFCKDTSFKDVKFDWQAVHAAYHKLKTQAVRNVSQTTIMLTPEMLPIVAGPKFEQKASIMLDRNGRPVKTMISTTPPRPNNYTLRFADMNLPCFGGEWPSDLGPRMYPPNKGPLATQWEATLKADCPACAPIPDVEDPAAMAQCKAVSGERLGYLPPWFVVGYWARGRKGWWNSELLKAPVPQVVGHLHYIAGAGNGMSKTYVLMGLQQWNWTAAHAVMGAAVFQAQRGKLAPKGPLKLLAFHPFLDLSKLTSFLQYQWLITGLVQVAHLLGRVPVYPDLPCTVTWTGEMALQRELPLKSMTHMAYGSSFTGLQCMWWGVMWESCMHNGRGMATLEFEHFKEYYRSSATGVEPTDQNTILALASSEALLRRVVEINPADGVLAILATTLLDGLASEVNNPAAVLYVSHPVQAIFESHVTGVVSPKVAAQRDSWRRQQAECPALSGEAVRNGYSRKYESMKTPLPLLFPGTMEGREVKRRPKPKATYLFHTPPGGFVQG